jgi:hypothetical protein
MMIIKLFLFPIQEILSLNVNIVVLLISGAAQSETLLQGVTKFRIIDLHTIIQ